MTTQITPPRHDRGIVGKGTPGKRIRSFWRANHSSIAGSLRAFVRFSIDGTEAKASPFAIDCRAWMASK